jgi:hypothetical protein
VRGNLSNDLLHSCSGYRDSRGQGTVVEVLEFPKYPSTLGIEDLSHALGASSDCYVLEQEHAKETVVCVVDDNGSDMGACQGCLRMQRWEQGLFQWLRGLRCWGKGLGHVG